MGVSCAGEVVDEDHPSIINVLSRGHPKKSKPSVQRSVRFCSPAGYPSEEKEGHRLVSDNVFGRLWKVKASAVA